MYNWILKKRKYLLNKREYHQLARHMPAKPAGPRHSLLFNTYFLFFNIHLYMIWHYFWLHFWWNYIISFADSLPSCAKCLQRYWSILAGVNCSQILIFILWFFPSAKLKFSEINFVTCWIFYYLLKKYLAKY